MFTKEDILLLLQTASSLSASSQTIEYIEDVGGSGIFASSYVKKEILKLIDEKHGMKGIVDYTFVSNS